MTKIYAQGNYIVIESNNERKTFQKKGVGFEIVNYDGLYSLNDKGLPMGDFNYSEVKKEDGSDYATPLEFETFLFENTGNFNSGADVSPNVIENKLDKPTLDGTYLVKKTGSVVSYETFSSVNSSNYYTKSETFSQTEINNLLSNKQDVLTEDNVGEFMDLELATKSTPSSGDTVLGRDSLTGKAVEIPTSSFGGGGSGLALGETESTAYRGDRGKIAYDHSQVTHDKNLVGLGNVDNTSDLNKPISTATQTALNTKANIVDIPTKTSFTHNILVSNWTLVSGKYEAVISNAGILANSFVDVIPSNDHVDIVRSAQIYPSVLISAGSVKVYSKFLPSGTISVTININ